MQDRTTLGIIISSFIIIMSLVALNLKATNELQQTTERVKYCEARGWQFSLAVKDKDNDLPDRCYNDSGVQHRF